MISSRHETDSDARCQNIHHCMSLPSPEHKISSLTMFGKCNWANSRNQFLLILDIIFIKCENNAFVVWRYFILNKLRSQNIQTEFKLYNVPTVYTVQRSKDVHE